MARKPKRTPKPARRRAPPAERARRATRRSPAGGAPPSDPPPVSEKLMRRLLTEVGRGGHRERWDILSRTLLNSVGGVEWTVQLGEEWVVCYALAPLPLKGENGERIEADAVLFCSQVAGDTWPQAQARVEAKRKAGIYEQHRFKLHVVEAKRSQQPGRDIAQLRAVRAAIRRRFGDEVPVDLTQFLAGPEPSEHTELPITGGNGRVRDLATVVRLDALDADQAPPAIRQSLLGAVAMLAMRHGGESRHLRATAARLLAAGADSLLIDVLNLVLHLDDGLSNMIIEAVFMYLEEKTMANGVAADSPEELRIFHRSMDRLVEGLKFPREVPALRKLLDARERAERERERAERKFEREQRAKHVDGLLSILAGRDMQLTKAQERRLRGLALDELPAFRLALRAKDATDFAVRAGLTNGGK